jgi:hypothetical protein
MGAITMMLDNPVSDPRSSQVFAPVLRTSATKTNFAAVAGRGFLFGQCVCVRFHLDRN